MKSKFTLLAALMVAFFAVNAQQVPNGGLNSWTNSLAPDGWTSYDAMFGTSLFVSQDTSNKVEGSSSAKIVSDSVSFAPQYGVVSGAIIAGTGSATGGQPTPNGLPFTFRPDTLFFSYKYTSPSPDTAGIELVFMSGGNPILQGGIPLTSTNGQWANVYVPITSYYTNSNSPDTLILAFYSSYSNVAVQGATLNVDAVRFGYVNLPSAINEVAENINVTVYPNPASDVINVTSEKNLAGFNFQIMDVTGRVVSSTALTGETTSVFVADLAKGNYIYKITDKNNGLVKQNKFAIVK